MSSVFLVDTYNMLHRARFGFATGPHAITFNFFRSLRSEFERHSPSKVYMVLEGYPIHRVSESNGEYKANRERLSDEGFHRQKTEIIELFSHLPVTVKRHPDFECDDVIATLARSHSSIGDDVTICSSDTDFIQLLDNDKIQLWNPVKKKFIEPWPVDYLVWKSLRGDPTDNIPGVAGVGEKTAFKLTADLNLLNEFLERDLLKKESFESSRRQIRLVNIDESCNKWESSDHEFSEESLYQEFKDREFSTIIEKSWPKWISTMENIK